MALGVLNNLSAIYAENNLNNTSNSLQQVLQQLSSGSRINSGADDAAGLSLINGLQANSTALTQSSTNATEGVGLLQVADGALSQVTNLLNRAVTLATEASNGTLNSAQASAADQEYQSIMAEINNIGTTTTYNQQLVFGGSTISIYTGDSSTSGSSIDNLTIRQQSTAGLGDTGGTITYNAGGGQNSVFIDMSKGSTNAGWNDNINGNTAATIWVDTLTSSGATVAKAISTGGTTGYPNTVGGLIDAINNSGLGLTASLTTGDIAGDTAAGAHTGIMITGSVGAGSNPSSASFGGSLTTASSATDTLSGSITIQEGSGAPATVTMAQVAAAEGSANLTNLAAYLNADTALGVQASLVGGKLSIASYNYTTGVATTDPLNVSSSLSDTTTGTSLNYSTASAYTVGLASSTGSFAAATLSTDDLTGQIVVQVGNGTAHTIKMSDVQAANGGHSTVAEVAAYITALGIGVTAGTASTNTVLTLTGTDPSSQITVTSSLADGGTSLGYSGSIGAYDSDSGQNGTTGASAVLGASGNTGTTATISYSDKAGESIANTDLKTQADAQSALIALNAAISDVASLDGYIGAQINTLNSISSVMNTQQENVKSAQNAIQATDYASATSNMSKYQVLTQTGIAALAQANSIEQEVTKLLQ